MLPQCDLAPSAMQQFLGILCNRQRAIFRIPEDKPRKLQGVIDDALGVADVAVPTPEKIAASSWTYYMFDDIKRAQVSCRQSRWTSTVTIAPKIGLRDEQGYNDETLDSNGARRTSVSRSTICIAYHQSRHRRLVAIVGVISPRIRPRFQFERGCLAEMAR